MAVNRMESAEGGAGGAPASVAAPEPPAPGGAKSWLPLIITMVAMPLLAYATTTYVLLPKLQHSLGAPAAETKETEAAPAGGGQHEGGGGAEAAAGKESAKAKGKSYAQMNKVLVNVAGTLGTRFLVVNLTLVSKRPAFGQDFTDNEPELRHVAISSLSSKTINDLERPGAKNQIRSELISLFNSVLGDGAVHELFFTEFAIQ